MKLNESTPSCDPLAQLVEHPPFKGRADGSSPSRITIFFAYMASSKQKNRDKKIPNGRF
jgi:hypothetical protein